MGPDGTTSFSQLDALLLANTEKPARERLTLIRVFEELRGLGYEGGYDAVRRYARVWRQARGNETAPAYAPLSFAPGEAYQFDWSHEIVLMNRMPVTVKVAHVRLCHSRMPFVRAYPRESQEMVHTGEVICQPALSAGASFVKHDPRHCRCPCSARRSSAACRGAAGQAGAFLYVRPSPDFACCQRRNNGSSSAIEIPQESALGVR